jgi:hypothetical protein
MSRMHVGRAYFRQHIFTRFNQREAYRKAFKDLKYDEILVAQDFGTLVCPPNASEREHYVTDHCVLLRWKVRTENKKNPDDPDWEERRLYIDLICDDTTRKNDFHFVRHSWDFLLFKTDHFSLFRHIIVFSDGASKHFKSRYTMKYFANMSVESARSIIYNFFASYHGSGLWDAHFAHNNTAIRNFLIKMEGIRKKRQSQNFSPLSEIKELVRVLMESLKDTIVYDVYNVDRDPSTKPIVKPLPNIKRYHTFKFIDADHIDCSIMCGKTHSHLNTIRMYG